MKAKCYRCKKLFDVATQNRKGRIPQYCKNCTQVKRYKHMTKEEIIKAPYDRRKLTKDNYKVTSKFWIVDDINIPQCSNCKSYITRNNDDDIINSNVIYDHKHSDLICKKCGLIIGKLELRGYINDDI